MKEFYLENRDSKYLSNLNQNLYTFINFGASEARSTETVEKTFGVGKGLGFNFHKKFIPNGGNLRPDTSLDDASIQNLPEKCVKFCSFWFVLEHLSSKEELVQLLNLGTKIAQDVIIY